MKASLSLSFIGLWMVLSNMCSAQPTLSISKTNGSPIIKWSAYSGGIYDLRRSPDMEVWTSETIVATNSQVSIQGTTTGHLFYEVGRVASPNGGFLNLKSGQVLSNTVTLQISGFTTDSSQVGYIALLYIVGNVTNQVDWIDLSNITNRQFTVDTRFLKNGLGKFGLKLISLTDSETGDGASVTYSDPIDVVLRNIFSVTCNAEQRFFLSVSTIRTGGTYNFLVLKEDGNLLTNKNGLVATSTNSAGEIILQDSNVVGNYEGAYFDVRLRLAGSNYTNIMNFRKKITKVPSVEIPSIGTYYLRNYVVCEDVGYFDTPARTNLENVLLEGLLGFKQIGPHRDLRAEVWTNNPPDWNVMETERDWLKMNMFYRGEYYNLGPTHIIVSGRGDHGGYYGAKNNPLSQFSTSSLQGFSQANWLTFGLFIGHEPLALINLFGETRKRTLQELRDQGLFPRYFAYLKGPHDENRANGDITEDEGIFWIRFISRICEIDSLGFSKYTFAEARIHASTRYDGTYNPASERLEFLGSEETHLDDLVTREE